MFDSMLGRGSFAEGERGNEIVLDVNLTVEVERRLFAIANDNPNEDRRGHIFLTVKRI